MKHEMIPSSVEGFNKQCRNCGMLDTQIRFGNRECVAAPHAGHEVGPEGGTASVTAECTHHTIEIAANDQATAHHIQVAVMQGNWMTGYLHRQIMRAAGQL